MVAFDNSFYLKVYAVSVRSLKGDRPMRITGLQLWVDFYRGSLTLETKVHLLEINHVLIIELI